MPVQVTPTTRQRVWALLVAVVLALIATGSLLTMRPTAPRDGSAPDDAFSAQRATTHLDRIAPAPHPTGSAANQDVVDYLTGALRELGLSPKVETSTVAHSFADRTHVAGTVSNVRAMLPGQDSTGRVLLVAHHDSVPIGPGANDDAVGVAVILEVVRALRAGTGQRNDVEILLTDGEEPGLLGARAYVESGAVGDPARVVVLNVEARGSSGPAIMFQAVGDTNGLMTALDAARTEATSLSDEVYGLLPNDTDLTVFADAGARGMNFAYVGGSPVYHAPYDDAGHVDAATVQDMGDSVLGAARRLAGEDLGRVEEDGNTYFTIFGRVLHYPSRVVLPLAALALLAYVITLAAGRRRGLAPRRVAVAAATFALPLLGSAAFAFALWRVLTALRPEYRQFMSGDTHRPEYYAGALACATAVALLLWYRWQRRRSTAAEVAGGVLGWFTALAVVSAPLVPGGSYLFVWPALLGCAALAAGVVRDTGDAPPRGVAVVAAVPAMALLLPTVVLLFPAMGIAMGAAPVVFAVLLGATMVGLVEAMPDWRALSMAMLALVAAVPLLTGVGLALDDYDAAHPRPVSLGYAVDTGTGEARWLSAADQADPLVRDVLTAGPVALDEQYPLVPGGQYLSGPARPAASAPDPTVEQVGTATERDGIRETRLRVRASGDPHTIAVYLDTSRLEVVGATAGGAAIDGGRNLPANRGPWRWGMRYAGPPDDGVELTVRTRGTGPLRLRVIAQSTGLPADAPRLPDDAAWTSYPSVAGQTMAARTIEL